MVRKLPMLCAIALTFSSLAITAQANPEHVATPLNTFGDTATSSKVISTPALITADNHSSVSRLQSNTTTFSVKNTVAPGVLSLNSFGHIEQNSVMPGVPEPSTMLLLGTGLLGALRYRARRKKQS